MGRKERRVFMTDKKSLIDIRNAQEEKKKGVQRYVRNQKCVNGREKLHIRKETHKYPGKRWPRTVVGRGKKNKGRMKIERAPDLDGEKRKSSRRKSRK